MKESSLQQKENFDYASLKNELYFMYKTCSQNLLQEQNIIDINKIKIDEIIVHIK